MVCYCMDWNRPYNVFGTPVNNKGVGVNKPSLSIEYKPSCLKANDIKLNSSSALLRPVSQNSTKNIRTGVLKGQNLTQPQRLNKNSINKTQMSVFATLSRRPTTTLCNRPRDTFSHPRVLISGGSIPLDRHTVTARSIRRRVTFSNTIALIPPESIPLHRYPVTAPSNGRRVTFSSTILEYVYIYGACVLPHTDTCDVVIPICHTSTKVSDITLTESLTLPCPKEQKPCNIPVVNTRRLLKKYFMKITGQ
jgi:hypothetical protein